MPFPEESSHTFGAGRHGRVGAETQRYRTTLVQLATWAHGRKLHGTLRTLRGTPERPKGWVGRKLCGTLRTLRGTPECPKGWVSRKLHGTLRTLKGHPRVS